MRDIAIIEAELKEAELAKRATESEISEKVRAYRSEVEAANKDVLGRPSKLRQELHEAKDAHARGAGAHPWTGKKVHRTEARYSGGGWNRKIDYVDVYGIVETRVSDTQLPANKSYGLPQLGEPFVRLLKANGKPGLAFASFPGRPNPWKLAEESVDAPVDTLPQGQDAEERLGAEQG